MPNITKRTNKDGSASFLIRVYVDETGTGHQITKSMTWRPPANMRPSTAEKEVVKQAALFEDKVKRGMVAFDSKTTFGEYALNWVENAPIAPATRQGYQDLMKRIVPALGHIRLEKLQSHHLEAFYKNLADSGVNLNKHYAESDKLKPIMEKRKISCEKLAKLSSLSPASVQSAARGKHVSVLTAEKISAALNLPTNELFVVHKSNTGLSQNSILHYHRLISAVLEKAKREWLVPFNVAGEHAAAPRVPHKEAKYLDDDQARTFLSLLLNEEDLRMKTALVLLLFTGARRGELCGLSWPDIDEGQELVHILRASQYQPGIGIVEVPTKNTGSVRAVKMPPFVFELLAQYRACWNSQKLLYGKYWKGQAQRLFIQEDGRPINPATINFWMKKFLKKHDFPYITPHSLRHTFATLQITAGVDVRTLQSLTGHAQASTLVNIYSHAIKSKQAAACDALAGVLLPENKTQTN